MKLLSATLLRFLILFHTGGIFCADGFQSNRLASTRNVLGRFDTFLKNKNDEIEPSETLRARIRKRVQKLAKNMVMTPIKLANQNVVVSVLSDATANAVDMAVDDLIERRMVARRETSKTTELMNPSELVQKTFAPVEESLDELEESIGRIRESILEAKKEANEAIELIQTASMAQALEGAAEAVEAAEMEASQKVLADLYVSSVDEESDIDISALSFEDVDYGTSEMAPPFLDETSCLVPGEPVVRVEKAPENSRRIFAGVDIMASVDDVWNVLTDYGHLQDVVPNLVVNEVLEEYSPVEDVRVDPNTAEVDQCRQIANQMKGSKLKQVGGAKVAGIRFSARTTLEVREWPEGMPDFAHFEDEVYEGQSRQERASAAAKIPLQRYRFPRPFAVSKLPTKDISMQSVENDNGEFRMYQGVWRMQPLPGCAPPGKEAMRLTYAVEVSPRAYLPVSLIEGRIVRDLCTNLEAIRDFVAKS